MPANYPLSLPQLLSSFPDGELPQDAPHNQPPDGPVVALSSWTDCLLCSNLSEFQWTLAFTESQNGMPNFESFYTMNSKSGAKNLSHFFMANHSVYIWLPVKSFVCLFKTKSRNHLVLYVCVYVCVYFCVYVCVYVCASMCMCVLSCAPLFETL